MRLAALFTASVADAPLRRAPVYLDAELGHFAVAFDAIELGVEFPLKCKELLG